ncbi:hypothetical protein LL252_17005 [Alcanivorax marinus]|uniref:Uncharacterized protein n=1 Tax=Alloalcanivorax marinus TaxID=1177169 RepID=A0A9Q3UNK8_9GAMM|nr:hypothetical protein [Alloalcanivorax marinus]MCC4310272.1 hypothetical protein [Alloalcanivorax marinus]
MDFLPVNILIPAGVICAALVAGAFSFVSLVLSKEQQVSELRQKWIDALREDISRYISALVATEEIYWAMEERYGDDIDVLSRSIETRSLHTELSISYSNIMMRLNPKDKSQHQTALRDSLISAKFMSSQGRWEEAVDMVDSIRESAQKALKEEWERVKRGEPSFVKAKIAALFIFFFLMGLVGFLISKMT